MAPERELAVRLGVFGAVFVSMALLELLAPRRELSASKTARWIGNLSLVAVDSLLLRVVFPAAALGVAALAEARDFGLLNRLDVPYALAFAGSVLLLDLVVYLQHVLFHAVPALWSLHMVHHADPDFDVTTGSRFHPLEIVISMVIKVTVVAALGPPVAAVLVFEVLLNATAMFNHSNVRLPLALDGVLRWAVVTPDMHRVHHSVRADETSSNFGFNLPWWDRALGTYRAQPEGGHEAMRIGLAQFREAPPTSLLRMLLLPFGGDIGNYSFRRSGRRGD